MIITEEFLKKSGYLYHSNMNIRKNQILNENQNLFSKSKNYDLFISHSSMDNDLVYTLIGLFNKAKYSVYVDYVEDPQLNRSNVNRITAETLRNRMKACNGLAYISTTNIVTSKWCPWELGYMDSNKNGKCAILPILKSYSNTFKGQEYLSLYPYIDYEKYKGKEEYEFWVNDPNDADKYVSLRKWLDGDKPYIHN